MEPISLIIGIIITFICGFFIIKKKFGENKGESKNDFVEHVKIIVAIGGIIAGPAVTFSGIEINMLNSQVVVNNTTIINHPSDTDDSITYGGKWTQVTPSAAWSPRSWAGSVVLPNGKIILIGGSTHTWSSEGEPFNDVWMSDDGGITWNQMTSKAEWPARIRFSCLALPDNSIILMGGTKGTACDKNYNDVWRSTNDGKNWISMTMNAEWEGRSRFGSVVMHDKSIVIIGGEDGCGGGLNDVWRSTNNGQNWTQVTDNIWLPVLYDFICIVNPDDGIVLLGGTDRQGMATNGVWMSVDGGKTWNQMTSNAEWEIRKDFSSVIMPDGLIYVMGGYDDQQYFSDIWKSGDNGGSWTKIKSNGGWTPRAGASAVALKDGRLLLMGGGQARYSAYKNDIWQFSMTP